ncbi:MAG: hypothetical protein WC349_02480 [Patescibacteria group bacterium]
MKAKIKKRIGDLNVDETIKILDKLSKSKALSKKLIYLFGGLSTHLIFLYTETFDLSGKDHKSINIALAIRKKIQNYILAQSQEEQEV